MLHQSIKRYFRRFPIAHEIRNALMPRRACHARIVNCLHTFLTSSPRSLETRATLALQSAQRVFPLIVEILSRQGLTVDDPIPVDSFLPRIDNHDTTARLKSLFESHGSDKATHNYHALYGGLFDRPNEVRRVLEIGFGVPGGPNGPLAKSGTRPGASLRAFRDFFPNAMIYGADVERSILFSEDRIKTFFVDQTELKTVDELSHNLPADLDLIVDDGLHSPDANLATIILAIKTLRVGGWLVIEDITMPSLPIWQAVCHVLLSNFRVSLLKARHSLLFIAQRR